MVHFPSRFIPINLKSVITAFLLDTHHKSDSVDNNRGSSLVASVLSFVLALQTGRKLMCVRSGFIYYCCYQFEFTQSLFKKKRVQCAKNGLST